MLKAEGYIEASFDCTYRPVEQDSFKKPNLHFESLARRVLEGLWLLLSSFPSCPSLHHVAVYVLPHTLSTLRQTNTRVSPQGLLGAVH